jgi:DNA-binding NarL/FixJ family response regulator
MTRVIVIADGGPTLEVLTRTLNGLKGVEIVRHLGGRPPAALMERLQPDLVFIDELTSPEACLEAVARSRTAAPDAAIVVRAARPEASWLADALEAGAHAVLPAVADVTTLQLVLDEVLDAARPAPTKTIDPPVAA